MLSSAAERCFLKALTHLKKNKKILKHYFRHGLLKISVILVTEDLILNHSIAVLFFLMTFNSYFNILKLLGYLYLHYHFYMLLAEC